MHFSDRRQFSDISVSQGSVVTCLTGGEIVNNTKSCTANLLLNLSVKEFWKSVKLWQSYGQDLGSSHTKGAIKWSYARRQHKIILCRYKWS